MSCLDWPQLGSIWAEAVERVRGRSWKIAEDRSWFPLTLIDGRFCSSTLGNTICSWLESQLKLVFSPSLRLLVSVLFDP